MLILLHIWHFIWQYQKSNTRVLKITKSSFCLSQDSKKSNAVHFRFHSDSPAHARRSVKLPGKPLTNCPLAPLPPSLPYRIKSKIIQFTFRKFQDHYILPLVLWSGVRLSSSGILFDGLSSTAFSADVLSMMFILTKSETLFSTLGDALTRRCFGRPTWFFSRCTIANNGEQELPTKVTTVWVISEWDRCAGSWGWKDRWGCCCPHQCIWASSSSRGKNGIGGYWYWWISERRELLWPIWNPSSAAPAKVSMKWRNQPFCRRHQIRPLSSFNNPLALDATLIGANPSSGLPSLPQKSVASW